MLFGNIHKGLQEFERTPGAVLIDVREADEFRKGHIPGAVSVPLSSMDDFSGPEDAALFLYCLRGTRSLRAAGILRKKGYKNVRSIGGIAAYRGEREV